MRTYDVCIVGFGPSGSVAANLLGDAGHAVLVIDRVPGVYDKPRAIALDHEIMRVFQRLSLTDIIAPHVASYRPSEYLGADGQLIKRLDSAPPPLAMGWPPNLSFTQPPVEAAIRQRAEGLATVDVRLGHAVEQVEQDGDGVSITLADGDVVRARYLIGADGANSTVRRQAGIVLDDLGFDEPWLVVDLKVDEAYLPRLPQANTQFCEPTRPATFVIGPGNHRRWEIMLNAHEDPAEMVRDAAVWKLLERWVTPGHASLWRAATYRFHALVASRWRDRRVFLVGDAAHQQPPFLGQGMCQGIRDAVNLAWKLNRVLAADAPDRLLDSYGAERGPHVRALTEIIRSLGRFVCERDPHAAAARDARLIAEMGGTVRTTFRQDLMPRLETGFLAPDRGEANGRLFPQPAIGGRLMDDLVGGGFRMMLTDAVSDEALHACSAVGGLKIVRFGQAAGDAAVAHDPARTWHLVEDDGVARAWFERHGCVAALVRPDDYVFGTAATAGDVGRLVGMFHAALEPDERGAIAA